MFEAYYRAVERERSLREDAFTHPFRTICGVEVRMMTLSDLLLLRAIGSPITEGDLPSRADVAQFLWIMSPAFQGFRERNRARWNRFLERLAKRYFVWRLRSINYEQAINEIDAYIEEVFMDAPPNEGGSRPGPAPKTSVAASWIDWAASEYGWSKETILATPLPCLFDCDRRSALRKDPKAVLFNKFSDRAKGEYLRAKNARSKSQ